MIIQSKRLIYLVPLFVSFDVASTVTPVQELNFGTVVVTKNTEVGSISIDQSGNIQINGGFALIDEGNHAIYELSDMPINRSLEVDVDIINTEMLSDTSSEETFELSIIRNNNIVRIDESGNGMLFFGGKIETSASGISRFTDTRYFSNIRITINL